MIRLLILSPLVFAACENITSEDIATESITANYTVSHINNSALSSVKVELKQGTSYIDLEGEDILRSYSNVNTSAVYLRRSIDLFNIISYKASVEGGNTTGDTFTILFERSSEQSSAPASTVSLAEPFSAPSTIPANSFDRNKDEITLSWTPSAQSEPLTLSTQGTCTKNITDQTIIDDGSYSFAISSFVNTYFQANTDPNSTDEYITVTNTQTCNLTISLKRTTTGSVNSNFRGGTFTGHQIANIVVESSYTQ